MGIFKEASILRRMTALISGVFLVLTTAFCSGSKYLDEIYPQNQPLSDSISVPERVTAGSESNFAPNLSPNGAYVIYTSDKTGNKDLWEKSTTGGYGRQLTFHSADDFSPVINNKGDQIAFVSRREDAAGDIHIKDLSSSPFSFASGNQSEGTLEVIQSNMTEDTNPEWFPDSSKIIFAARKPGDKYPQITVASLDDLIPKPLGEARGDQPSVSPDGNQVVYVKDGGLRLYDIEAEKDYALTEGGYLQDGQPRFSNSGEEIVFIRYADDTNNDGFLNADDRSSIWKLTVKSALADKNKQTYLVTPLTTSSFAGYNPQMTSPFLYLTLQTHNGLDIFKLSESGQITPAIDLDKLRSQRDLAPDLWSKLYVLRLGATHFFKLNQQSHAAEAALMELDLLSRNSRQPEFIWAYRKFKATFGNQSQWTTLADLFRLNLELQPLRYQLGSSDLTKDQEEKLNEVEGGVMAIIKGLQGKSQANKQPYDSRITAMAKYIRAQIAASRRKFFESYAIIEEIVLNHPDQTEICAQVQLFHASMIPATSDTSTALEKLKTVVQKYKSQRSVAIDAGSLAISLTSARPVEQTEILGQLKESAKGLPILPAIAHMKIAEIFASENKKAVYANELRQIVDLYPDSPEVTLAAAEKLLPLEEADGRYTNSEESLRRLFEKIKGDVPEYKMRAKSLLMETILHHGEYFLRKNAFADACREYEKVISIDSLNVSGHRGLVDCKFKLGQLDEILDTYQEKAEDYPNHAAYAYIYGYALTYLIDGESSPRLKLGAIDDSIDQIEIARSINSQILQIHQTLGWLYFQRGYWQDRYYKSGSVLGSVRQKAGMVQNFFGVTSPNWLQLSIDSYHTAYFLSKENSYERVTIALNLGQTYYELKNFQKALTYYLERIKRLEEIPLRDPRTEGVLFRRAGRSAFQIDELQLAENLQKEALNRWESLNDDLEVSYSTDALALTQREQGKYRDAIKLYERLLEATTRNNQTLNKLGALSNLGYCYFVDNKFDESLKYFDLAQAELDQMNAKDEDADDSNGAIKVDLGGQGSAAKGFDLFARRNLILSFKASIYGKLNRLDLQLDSLNKKLEILSAHRESEIDDAGKSEKFMAEEISITQNNIAALKLSLGRQDQSIQGFRDAEATAKLLRPEDQTYKNKGEITNALNASRLDLRLASLNILGGGDIKQRYMDLKEAADNLKPVYKSGSKEQGQSIAEFMALATSFKRIIDPKSTDTDALLVDTVQIVKRGDLSDQVKNGALLAFNGSDKNQIDLSKEGFLAEPANQVKPGETKEADNPSDIASYTELLEQSKASFKDKQQYGWKLAIINKNLGQAQKALEELVLDGGFLSNPVDRRLARSLAELKIVESIKGKNEGALITAVRDQNRYRLLEMINRGTANIEKEKRDEILGYYRGLLEVKNLEFLATALKSREHILLAYRTLGGYLAVVHLTKEGDKISPTVVSSYGKPNATWSEESARLRLAVTALINSPLIAQKIKPGDSLYIVPAMELHGLEWESLNFKGQKLGKAHVLAYLPAVEALPEYVAKGKILKNWIGLVSQHTEIPDKTTNPFQKILNDQQSFEEINGDGEKSLVKSIRNYNIVHIEKPILISQSEPAKTTLLMVIKKDLNDQESKPDDEPLKESHRDDLYLNDFLTSPTPQTTGIIFANLKESAERYSIGEGEDAWAYLSLVTLKAGIPSILLTTSKPESTEEESGSIESGFEEWTTFYNKLADSSISESLHQSAIEGRVYGFFGISSSQELAFAKDRIEKTVNQADEAYDDGDYLLASELYKEALFYNDRIGKKDNDVLDRIVASLFQLREYSAALHFKKIASSRLKPAPKGQPGADKDPVDYGNSVIEAAVLAVRAKKHKQAESLLNEAETIFKAEEDYAQLGKIAQYRGIDAENQKNYEKTIEWYRVSMDLYSKVNKGESTQRLLNIGNIYNARLSEYAKAIEYYELAEANFKAEGSKDYIPVLIDKANAFIAIGQVEDAIILLERNVITRLDKDKEKDLWVRSTQLLASAYLRSGLLVQAKELNEKTIIESRKIEDSRDKMKPISREIDAIGLKGYILSAMGDFTGGFEEFKNAINIANKYKLKGQLAVLYNNYGFWAREYGAVDESIEFFSLALKYDTELKSKSGIAVDQRNMALSVILKGDYTRAKDLLQVSLKTSQELNLVYNSIYCQFGLGDIALRENQFDLARKHFEESLRIAQKNGFKEFIWKSHAGIAQAELELGSFEKSAGESAKAIAIIESQKAGLKSGSSKSEFQSEKGVQEVYQTYAVALMKLGKIDKAWSLAEKARGRAYLDSFGSKKINLANEDSQRLLLEEQRLRRSLDGAMSYHRRLQSAGVSGPKAASALQEVNKFAAARRGVIAQMYKLDKQLLELVTTSAISAGEVAKKLPDSTGILEYLVTKNNLLVWFVAEGKVAGKMIPMNPTDFSKKIADYRLLMQNYSSPQYLGQELSDLLLMPFAEELKKLKRVLIVPHKDLHFVSFASLPLYGKFTIDQFSLAYLESSTFLRYIPEQSVPFDPNGTKILAFSNPNDPLKDRPNLPFATKEAEVLKRYFRNVEVHNGQNATETKLKQAKSLDILHIGSHGVFNDKFPEDSSILLSADKDNDGFLKIMEIFGLNLRPKMVTLSACESGMGVISSADEIIGLNRAFFQTGATTLVSALWRINDVTSAVTMKRFYRNLATGQPKDLALVNAQKVVRTYFKHPAYWAAFRVVGDWK